MASPPSPLHRIICSSRGTKGEDILLRSGLPNTFAKEIRSSGKLSFFFFSFQNFPLLGLVESVREGARTQRGPHLEHVEKEGRPCLSRTILSQLHHLQQAYYLPRDGCTLPAEDDTLSGRASTSLSQSGSNSCNGGSDRFHDMPSTMRPANKAGSRSRRRPEQNTVTRLAGFRGVDNLISTTINHSDGPVKIWTEVQPTESHQHTFIFLSGPELNTRDFSKHILRFRASDGRNLMEIYPHSKWVLCTIEMGFWMTDKGALQLNNPLFRDQIDILHVMLLRESMDLGNDYGKLTLAGIGHGCAIAASTLITQPNRLGGFIGMNGWMPSEAELAQMGLTVHTRGANLQTQAMLTHAGTDGKISVDEGYRMCSALTIMGMSVMFTEYGDGGHGVHRRSGVDDFVWFMEHVAGAGRSEAFYACVERRLARP